MPDGAFLIHLRKMNHVFVDPAAMTVTAGGGAKIGEVDAALQPHNFAVPLGTHPDTGIGGLTLGGGIGWLTPRVGLAVDNLVSAEVTHLDHSTHIHASRQICRQVTHIHTSTQAHRQTGRQTDRETERQSRRINGCAHRWCSQTARW